MAVSKRTPKSVQRRGPAVYAALASLREQLELHESAILDLPPGSPVKFNTYGVVTGLRYAIDILTKGGGTEEPKRCGHCWACTDESCREFEGHCMVYNPTEDEEKKPCRVCGDPRCLYQAAREDGIECGMQWDFSRWHDAKTAADNAARRERA